MKWATTVLPALLGLCRRHWFLERSEERSPPADDLLFWIAVGLIVYLLMRNRTREELKQTQIP
jgi:hypothetical protein